MLRLVLRFFEDALSSRDSIFPRGLCVVKVSSGSVIARVPDVVEGVGDKRFASTPNNQSVVAESLFRTKVAVNVKSPSDQKAGTDNHGYVNKDEIRICCEASKRNTQLAFSSS